MSREKSPVEHLQEAQKHLRRAAWIIGFVVVVQAIALTVSIVSAVAG